MRKIKHRLAGLRNIVSQSQTVATKQAEKTLQSEDGDGKNRDVFRKSSTATKENRPDWYQATHGSDY